ncbi:MAG: branched-chain amino acid aminotransferase [Abditibacteriota bacterium]|nr:branched-chain amino acid aminotransferase [Abditibacteriota bacterium]
MVSVHSAGTMLGWGVFTTLGVVNGRATFVERHLQRLRRDALAMDLTLDFDDAALHSALSVTIEANRVRSGMARLTLTARGDERWNTTVSSPSQADLSILAISCATPPLNGLRLQLSPHRIEARRPLAGVKSTSYAPHQWLWRQARQQNFDEVLLCNNRGIVCEAARANLFWVSRGELCTPELSSGCLPGIARELLLHWAATELPIREGSFQPGDLSHADELFLSSSATGPRGIGALVNSTTRGETFTEEWPAPGPLTRQLQQRWAQETDSLV